jgi:hypothetical protein
MQTIQIVVNLSLPFKSLIDMILDEMELKLQKLGALLKNLAIANHISNLFCDRRQLIYTRKRY